MGDAVNNIVITGMGMATALGSSEMGSNAARAGISMIQLLDYEVPNVDDLKQEAETSPIKGHPYHNFTEGKAGLDRLICLGQDGLKELMETSGLKDLSKCGLIVNLSDGFHGAVVELSEAQDKSDNGQAQESNLAKKQETYRQDLIAQLLAGAGCDTQPSFSTIGFGGKPGIVNSLALAQTLLDQGQVEKCIIGAIESCLDPEYLQVCLKLEILKTEHNSSGFIPGEAGAFLLLEKQSQATKTNSHCYAVVDSYHIAQSTSQRFLNDESTIDQVQCLCETLSHCINTSTPENITLVSDFSGEPERAKTWAYTQTRLSNLLKSLEIKQSSYPAIQFGEVGAAFAYIALILACQAYTKGYAPSDNTLIWTLSDNGTSASVMIKKC